MLAYQVFDCILIDLLSGTFNRHEENKEDCLHSPRMYERNYLHEHPKNTFSNSQIKLIMARTVKLFK